MALNKRFNDIQKLYDKLGRNNADTLKNAMAKSPDYMYIAFLTQRGTDAPVDNVLYNDLVSASPVYFSYEGIGIYRIHCNLFKPGYMEVEIQNAQGNTFVDNIITATVYTGYVELLVNDSGSPADAILRNTPIKIRVWNKTSIPVASPPPIPQSMWYGILVDDTGGNFVNFPTDWTLNGDLLFNSNITITNPPYSGNGNATQIFDPFDPYGAGSTFRAFTIEDVGFAMPTPWLGTDNFGGGVTMNFTEITTKKTFSGNITPTPGTTDVSWIICDEFTDSINFPQDLSSPMVNSTFTALLQTIFGSQASITVIVNGPDDYTVTISNIYTASTQIGLYMTDNNTYTISEI